MNKSASSTRAFPRRCGEHLACKKKKGRNNKREARDWNDGNERRARAGSEAGEEKIREVRVRVNTQEVD